LCREEGRALSKLAANTNKNNDLDGFKLFGVVKETGVDDAGLHEFQSKFYPKPLYRDINRATYDNFFGGRKLVTVRSTLSALFHPIRTYRGFREVSRRLKDGGENGDLEGNLIGEGLLLGGVILFGNDGKPKYAYREETGMELPVDDIAAVARALRVEQGE
jgi:hypothetical protein